MSAATETGTRWLSAEEQQAWIGLTAVMWLLPPRLDAQLQKDSSLTLFEYFVLSRLSMAPQRRLRMRELAAIANGSRSRLSNVVGKLESQGWIARSSITSDRRGAVAELTPAGWEVVVAAAPRHVECVRTLVFDALQPEQVAALSSLGASLGASLSEADTGAVASCDDEAGAC